MGLTRAEQETVFRWDEEEKVVHVFSASPVTWRKLARLGIRPHRETTIQGTPAGKCYRLPHAQFRWGLKRTRTDGPPQGFARRNPAADGVSREPNPDSEAGA